MLPEVDSELLDIVGSIYDTAINVQQWPEILDRVAPKLGAYSSALLALDLNQRYNYNISATSSNLPLEKHQHYIENYSKYEAPHFENVANSSAGTIVDERVKYIDKSLFDCRPDVLYLKNQFGVLERFAMKLNDDPSWFECITFQYTLGRGNITSDEEGRLRVLLPHMAKATELSRTFTLLKHRYSAVLGALDKLSIGMLLVDGCGNVLIRNKAASIIVDESKYLSFLNNNRLKIAPMELNRLLGLYIKEAASTANAENTASTRTITVGEKDNPILLDITPLRDTNREVESSLRGAIVSIYDPDKHDNLDLSDFKNIFGFTDAETAVLCHLIHGLTNKDIAERRNVGVETIKVQIRNILAKTGTSNRTQIIKKILGYQLPLL